MRRRVASRAAVTAALMIAALVALLAAGCGGGGEETTADLPDGKAPLLGYNDVPGVGGVGNDLIAKSGASFVRISLSWSQVESSRGKLNWDAYDAIDKDFRDNGLRPLWVVGSAPCWASILPCKEPMTTLAPAPEHYGEFADFVTEVAKRYPDAVGIEVWNEPNIPNFWKPAPDTDAYRELLSQTADAVHATNAKVPILFSGPSPTTQEQADEDPAKIPFVQFISLVMSGPDRPDVDAIGLHPYSLLQRGEDPIDETIRLYEEGRDAAEEAAPGVPVWVTEVGLTTAGKFAISPEEQAAGLESIVRDLAEDGVPVITIHRFFDQPDPPQKFEEGFGVVAADRQTPKLSFCSAADAVGVDCEAP